MMLLALAYKSLTNRKLTTTLTLASIALSVGLLIGVEHVRVGVRENFAHTLSQTDLIVGARGGALQLLLYAVFGMGSATNNLSYASYEKLKHHPAVQWTIPYSLGDSHRGFRVIGTTEDFYQRVPLSPESPSWRSRPAAPPAMSSTWCLGTRWRSNSATGSARPLS